jgi:membrane complex biogenesis BtpA family protein
MPQALFPKSKPVIGVIHLGALPGTPLSNLSVTELTELALSEARLYREGGVDAVMIENMHDTPYQRGGVGAEIVAAMAIIGRAVKLESRLPTGVQVLAAANREAMAVAHAAELDFIRAEGYAFAHVADEGLIEASAAELLRYRKLIGAERIEVWADIKKKHSSHAITADVSLGEMAAAVEFMRGDAVIVTGHVTGEPPSASDVREAKAHSGLSVLLGSGITPENIADYYALGDGFIVGSSFKRDGRWALGVELARVQQLMNKVQKLRTQNQ